MCVCAVKEAEGRERANRARQRSMAIRDAKSQLANSTDRPSAALCRRYGYEHTGCSLLLVDTGQESTEPMIDVPGEVCAPDKARRRERGQRHGREVNAKVMRQLSFTRLRRTKARNACALAVPLDDSNAKWDGYGDQGMRVCRPATQFREHTYAPSRKQWPS